MKHRAVAVTISSILANTATPGLSSRLSFGHTNCTTLIPSSGLVCLLSILVRVGLVPVLDLVPLSSNIALQFSGSLEMKFHCH